MPSIGAGLNGVAAISPTNAWAVGYSSAGDTLILHWNGKTWQQTPSPNPGSDQGLSSFLGGVAVSSGHTMWAVGDGSNCGCGPGESLAARWNGQTWEQVPTPTPGGGTNLLAVASLPLGRAWAVGESGSGDGPTNGVMLQWTGTAWTRVALPDLRSVEGGLFDVAATSRTNAWAVGWESAGGGPADTPGNSGTPKIVILHLTGSAWKSVFHIVSSPDAAAGGTSVTTTTTTTLPATTSTTVSPATKPPSAGTAAGPLLGSAAWGQAAGSFAGISGFGEAAPSSFSEGATAESPHVDSISWSNWGAAQATGQGQAIDGTGQTGDVASWPVVSATVVAFDLGTCDGTTPAYQEVTYYFPQDGQTFDPTKATNACTGE